MKNFLRALRHALPYQRRLVLSVVCAALAALLWGLNFTSIYPVLKILGTGQTAQQWVDKRINEAQAEIAKLEAESERQSVSEKEIRDKQAKDPNKVHDQRLRDLTYDQART